MAKEDLLVLDGLIDEKFPDGRFRVHLENGHQIIAYTAARCGDPASALWSETVFRSN